MNVVTIISLTALIVIVGQWSQKNQLNMKIAVGGAFAAIMLTAIAQWNEKFAVSFATISLVTAVIIYGGPLAKAINKATG